ncbi:MAG: hypothetical protein IPJ36_11850 [Simplicispira sp.]|nr:hypothetical protein [Simplicispira sp.]
MTSRRSPFRSTTSMQSWYACRCAGTPQNLGRFMVFFGPISSVFDILTFALM